MDNRVCARTHAHTHIHTDEYTCSSACICAHTVLRPADKIEKLGKKGGS